MSTSKLVTFYIHFIIVINSYGKRLLHFRIRMYILSNIVLITDIVWVNRKYDCCIIPCNLPLELIWIIKWIIFRNCIVIDKFNRTSMKSNNNVGNSRYVRYNNQKLIFTNSSIQKILCDYYCFELVLFVILILK